MAITATVIKNGNSAAVVLPAAWCEQHGISVGDKLKIDDVVFGKLVITTPNRVNRCEEVSELGDFLSSLPYIPWEGGDSPEDDKRLVGMRYE